jgi:ribosome recycling factor
MIRQLAFILFFVALSVSLGFKFQLPIRTHRSNACWLNMAKDKGGKGGGSSAAPTEFVWKTFKKGTEDKMTKSLDSILGQFNTLRAGGANPAMLDRVFVDCFGTPTPLQQVARVGTSGSQQIVIEPFDKSLLKEIEKAISTSDLNLTPTNDGSGVVRINIPPLTEDRRKELAKQAKVICEDGKVAIRNHRRDSVDKVKDLEKAKTISKDDAKGFTDDLQKVTDDFIKKLDGMLKKKEDDLMKV